MDLLTTETFRTLDGSGGLAGGVRAAAGVAAACGLGKLGVAVATLDGDTTPPDGAPLVEPGDATPAQATSG